MLDSLPTHENMEAFKLQHFSLFSRDPIHEITKKKNGANFNFSAAKLFQAPQYENCLHLVLFQYPLRGLGACY